MRQSNLNPTGFNPIRMVPTVYFSFNDHPLRKPSLVVYFCGCPHRCKGCYSPELQNPHYEICSNFTPDEVVRRILSYRARMLDRVNSLVLLGGDPVLYSEGLSAALEKLKEKVPDFEIVLYTGFLFEEVPEKLKEKVDVVIDGKYREDLKTGKFPASSNQRVWIKENGKWKDITNKFLKKEENQNKSLTALTA